MKKSAQCFTNTKSIYWNCCESDFRNTSQADKDVAKALQVVSDNMESFPHKPNASTVAGG